jgi:hypothetical protein
MIEHQSLSTVTNQMNAEEGIWLNRAFLGMLEIKRFPRRRVGLPPPDFDSHINPQ